MCRPCGGKTSGRLRLAQIGPWSSEVVHRAALGRGLNSVEIHTIADLEALRVPSEAEPVVSAQVAKIRAASVVDAQPWWGDPSDRVPEEDQQSSMDHRFIFC